MADHDEVIAAYQELGQLMLADTPLGESLSRIADVVKSVLPQARDVSVTLIPLRGQPYTAAFSSGSQLAAALDERQYRTGSGPCLDAALNGETIVIADTGRSRQYRDFARQAHRAGITNVLAVGMPWLHQTSGALNIYGAGPPFPRQVRALAADLAGCAGIALMNASRYSEALTEVQQIREAMASRAVIEQAKGIIMTRCRCDADHAFRLLRDASSRSNRKLRDIAQDIVATSTARHPAKATTASPQSGPHPAGPTASWDSRTDQSEAAAVRARVD